MCHSLNLRELLHPPFKKPCSGCSVVVFCCSVYTSNMSSYFNLLSYITQKRHLTKLNIDECTLQDPYTIEESLWSEDMSKWPDLQFVDIYTYLVDTEGCYTKEKLKAFKSLEAYNYFYNGYVRTVYLGSLAYTRLK